MTPESKIFVAGHRGLVGSALVRQLQAKGYRQLILRAHTELDLCDQVAVRNFFEREKPEYVFLAAAKVGGIYANDTHPATFLYRNIAIQTNVIHSAYTSGVKKLLFLGSSCIYPRQTAQPMAETQLLTGALEPTNEPYAIAKIAGIKMCAAYNREYRTDFLSVIPSNIYGPGDNYDLENSHFLPALIRKMHDARISGSSTVTIWGTGQPRRELLYSDDLADACVFLMERYHARDIGECVNIGTGVDHTITDLALKIAQLVNFDGKLTYDNSRPDGTPRKLLDVSRMRTLGWSATTELDAGIRLAYKDFLLRYSPGLN